MKIYYKIIEFKNCEIKTLFHRRKHPLTISKWLKACNVLGRDGSGQKRYCTGWHIFADREMAEIYFERFKSKKDRYIIECFAKNVRPKPTNENVLLAEYIKLTNRIWLPNFLVYGSNVGI